MTTDVRDARSLPEEGFHEIQLSGKQLVFLFMATTVVSVFIFLCGVLVGRNVRVEAADVTPSALAATPAPALTDSLTPTADPAAALPPSEPVPEASADALPPPAGAASEANPSSAGRGYYDQLMSDKPPAETVTSADERPVPTPAPPPPARVEPPPAAPPPATAGGWVVQVTALRQRQEAAAIATRLAGRGYKAFVLDPQPGSTSLYRVRVGPFAERAEADETVKRLTREEQFNPWISR
jgi:DedD protein